MKEQINLGRIVENARRNRENPLTPGARVVDIVDGNGEGVVVALDPKWKGSVVVRFDKGEEMVRVLTFALRRIENDEEA